MADQARLEVVMVVDMYLLLSIYQQAHWQTLALAVAALLVGLVIQAVMAALVSLLSVTHKLT